MERADWNSLKVAVLGSHHQALQKETRMLVLRPLCARLLLLFTCLPFEYLTRRSRVVACPCLCDDTRGSWEWKASVALRNEKYNSVLLSPSAGHLDHMQWKQDAQKIHQIILYTLTHFMVYFVNYLKTSVRLKMMHVGCDLENLHMMAVLYIHSLFPYWCTFANRWHHSLTGNELQCAASVMGFVPLPNGL